MKIRISAWRLCICLGVCIAIPAQCAHGHGRLVAQWDFDQDSAGRVLDRSGNGYDGRAYHLEYGGGVNEYAGSFDGVSSEVRIPNREDMPPQAIGDLVYGSISVWFNFERTDSGDVLPILYWGEAQTGTLHNSLIIEIGHGNDPTNRRLYFTIVNAHFCFDSGANLQPGQWYHFVAVVGPKGNTGYLNSREMTDRRYNLGSGPADREFFASVSVREMLAIGYGRYGQSDPFYRYKGRIDDVRIYDEPLDSNQVTQLYQVGQATLPTFENVAYGPYERNVLDLWQADVNRPAPLVVFIHGGGFANGDKAQQRTTAGAAEIASYREQGISFAAINYRLRDTTPLDQILLDCARAVQFLRWKSNDWNVDPGRIVAYGHSAGGGASLWMGWHDDLADPCNPDPVLRESSRLTAIGHLNSQATYDFVQWPLILDMDPNWIAVLMSASDPDVLAARDPNQLTDPNMLALRASLDMPAFLDANDPPLYTYNVKPDVEPQAIDDIMHHPRHAMYLRDLCQAAGHPCVAVLADTPVEERISYQEFFLEHLLGPDAEDPNR
ncbi:MAG: alpha/beta hydrolase fold domain-containing protein [Sedimentisphaerales bacterium]|nr:alpha/beta hydrolase fold domain-containing protein [Sedimentisphaerales bacterium]